MGLYDSEAIRSCKMTAAFFLVPLLTKDIIVYAVI